MIVTVKKITYLSSIRFARNLYRVSIIFNEKMRLSFGMKVKRKIPNEIRLMLIQRHTIPWSIYNFIFIDLGAVYLVHSVVLNGSLKQKDVTTI